MRLVACAVLSIVGHLVLREALEELPARPAPAAARPLAIRIVDPPPPPPPPEPPPPPPPPKPPEPDRPKPVHERPRVRPVQPALRAEAPREAPSLDATPTAADTTPTPVFGVTMSSTSQGGTGPAVPVGNTTRPAPAGRGDSKPLLAPAAAFEVTKLPVPQGRCSGAYTEAARAAAIEGTVILDLIVDETGRARDIAVVQGLGHGLTEAAIAALSRCRFTPGEKDGAPVPVRVRGFKIRFLMEDTR